MSVRISAITALNELCTKHRSAMPTYDLVANDDSLNRYVCTVNVFCYKARGKGNSEADAKLKAATNIIKVFKEMDEFKDDLTDGLIKPLQCTEAVKAFGQLFDICYGRGWPFPTFEVSIATDTGTPFECHCRIASLQSVGYSSSKRGAKGIAALEMLNICLNLNEQQIATITDALYPDE